MRPHKRSPADYPGTVRKHADGICVNCVARKKTEVEASKKKIRTLKRLISERVEGDDYLLVIEALGIGDDID